MSDDLHALLIRLDADTRRMQANVTRATRHVDGKLGHIEKRLKRSDQRFEKWGKNIARNVRVGLAAAVVLAGRQALLTADKIDVLQDRIKDATRESGGFNKVWDGITATAIKTGSVLGNNVELFQRLSIAAGDLGATNTDILRLNETVQKLGIISGASTSSLAAGTTQLAQGLGAGIFRAEEFNSILENIPAVANAIAKSLGKSTSELRKMVLAGKLASKDVFQALIESSAEVDKRFSEIPPRLERAWSGLLTAMATRIDKVNDALKITVALASSLEGLTQLITQDDVSEIEMLAQEIGNLEREIEKLNKTRMHFGYLDIAKEKTEELLKLHSKMMNMIAISGKPNIPTIFPNDTTRQGFSIDQKSKPKDRFVHGDTPAPKAKPGDPVVRQGINDAEAKIISLIAASEAEEKQVGMTAAAITRMNAEMEIYADLAARGIIATDKQKQAITSQLDAFEKQARATEKASESFKELERMSDQFAEDFGDIFIDSIGRGESALDALKNTFKNTLLKMATDALIINPLKNLFSPKGGNLLGNIFGSFLGKAGGGDISGTEIVGERGPELFIPKVPGTIRNNSDSRRMMGGSTNIEIINQTSGRITATQEMTEGRVRMILREELPGGMAAQTAAPNSPFSKTFKQNYNAPRRFR